MIQPQLLQGNCLDELKEIEDMSVDLVLADPPYGTTACKWDSIIPLIPLWEHLKRIIKPEGAIILMASQPFTSTLVCSNQGMFKHEWIWIKNRGSNFLNTKREPMKEHESVLVFANKKWTFNRQMEDRSPEGYNRSKMPIKMKTDTEVYGKIEGMKQTYIGEKRVPRSHQFFKTAAGKTKTKHPTQKPVELMEYLINTYSNKGALVLDFVMGSGTTGVACIRLDRNFIGIELDAEYCEIAREHIAGENARLF